MGEPAGRRARRVALIPLFGLIFWLTALMASSVPGLLVLGVNVHGLPPTSYAGGPSVALAPLSQKIIEEARQDRRLANGAPPSANPSANPSAEPSGGPPPSSTHPGASPAGTSSPVTTGGSAPSPTPTPSATPAPIVSILPTPLPTILPSPTPTAVRSAITGQVLDEVTHLGIAAATVAISGGSSTLTDVNGNFSFSVNAGTYTMTASATGYTSASQTVTVNGGQSVSVGFKLVSLTATGGIKGIVTNSVTAAAVVGATLTLSNGLTSVTDVNGNFSFPVVPYGTYTLTASALGYVSQSQSVTVKPGHTTTLNFQLVP